MSGLLNLPIDAGATRRISFSVTVDGDPMDFAGAEATFISTHVTTPLDVAGNVLTLEFAPPETRVMTRSRYAIDVTFASGDVVRLLTGYLIVSPYPEVADEVAA